MCSFLCRLSTRLPCMRVSVCVKLCGGVRTAPTACKQLSSGSWCMFVRSQGLSVRALGLFLAGRGCGVSGNAGDCTVPQLHLLNTGCSLEPSACLGGCERGCVPNGKVNRGGQGDEDCFGAPGAALRGSEGQGRVLGRRLAQGEVPSRYLGGMVAKLSAVSLQMGTGGPCSSPRARQTPLRPGRGKGHPAGLRARSRAGSALASLCPRLTPCEVPRKSALWSLLVAQYVRLLFPGSARG